MTPAVRYPSNPVTPQGAHQILRNRIPQMGLVAHDESIVFHLMGGLSIPDRQTPERVEITGLRGLTPPWNTIDQKGATDDGVSFVDALYDPCVIDMDVVVHGRNPSWARKVHNHLMASLDVKEEGRLFWFTHEMGYWWAPIRWYKTPETPDTFKKRQPKHLVLRADNAFWQSYPNVASFQPTYEDFNDRFTTDYTTPHGLGPNWPLYYGPTPNYGWIYADGDAAYWHDFASTLTESQEVVAGPYDDGDFSETTTDNQSMSMTFGSFQEWSFPQGAANDLWLRMGRNPDGTWNGYGIRFRIENNIAKLSRFNAFSQTVMKQQVMLIPPLPAETYTAIAGYEDDPRMFKVFRNGTQLLWHREEGTGSALGEDYRGLGFGMQAGAAVITQATPASVRRVWGGDHTEVSQTGFLERINAGDQPGWDNYTVFGPFSKIRIWNGPNAGPDEYVEFGPLLSGQVAQIRSDPRRYGVKTIISTPDQANVQYDNTLVQQLYTFVTNSDDRVLQQFFTGVANFLGLKQALPPQVNLYSLLDGRFSRPIPAKPAGRPAVKHHIKVEIVGGNADTKIIASLTPLRRYPF